MADAQPQMQARYEKDPNMVFRQIEDEMILVPIRQSVADLGNIYVLNELGGRIWELMDGERTLADVRDILLDEYDVMPNVLEADLLAFVRQLEAAGSIKRVE